MDDFLKEEKKREARELRDLAREIELEDKTVLLAQREAEEALKGVRKACEENGITPEQWKVMWGNDPEGRVEQAGKNTYAYTNALIRRNKGKDGRFISNKQAAEAMVPDEDPEFTKLNQDRVRYGADPISRPGKERVESAKKVHEELKAGRISSDKSLVEKVRLLM